MVVATKEIKIESGYCPALSMHVGEVNKQYILVPPIDISGYSVRSEIVKPDHTFVYTDQAINTDGNILFTLPEQAGAVAGYGYYIIKIYNLNTIVYSAVGNLIIDDHLIMDGMIESVAEVNGYNFPDDFMMRGDLSFIFDDTAVSNETGWTSTKIKNYVDQSVLENYSTSERVVGTWIDGKPLYEKTFTSQLSGKRLSIDISDLDVENAFIAGGFYDIGVTCISLNEFMTTSAYSYTHINTGTTPPIIDCNCFVASNATVYATIRYTKTTD